MSNNPVVKKRIALHENFPRNTENNIPSNL